PHALLLFLIIFAWTPPHFWALAIARRNDYRNADIPMLPVTHGVAFTRLHILLYTVVLFIVSLLPFITWLSGPLYLAGAVVLGGVFLYYALRMQRDHSDALAMRTFNYSVFYLMALFAFLLVDHYMPLLVRLLTAGGNRPRPPRQTRRAGTRALQCVGATGLGRLGRPRRAGTRALQCVGATGPGRLGRPRRA